VFIKEPLVILQQNNFLKVSYFSILLVASSNSLKYIIIIWTSIFPCYIWGSIDILAIIIHVACSFLSTWHCYSVITSLFASLTRTWGIEFSRTYNLLPWLRIILIFWYQSKKFGPVNLLASCVLHKDIFIFTHGNLSTYSCKDNKYWFHA